MIDIKVSAVIPRSVEEVFDYVSQPENWPHWQESVEDIQKINPGPDGQGSRYHYKASVGGHNVATTVVVTEYRPHEEIAFEGDWAGNVRPQGNICFEPVDQGTRVTIAMKPRTRGAYKFLEGTSASVLRETNEQGLQRLKDLLTDPEREGS